METNARSDNETRVREISSGTVLLGRVMWMMIGPAALLGIIYAITANGSGWFRTADAAYGAVVALMIWGRWIEQRSGAATTASGEAATAQHFRRYVRTLLPLAVGVWVAANVVGKHFLI